MNVCIYAGVLYFCVQYAGYDCGEWHTILYTVRVFVAIQIAGEGLLHLKWPNCNYLSVSQMITIQHKQARTVINAFESCLNNGWIICLLLLIVFFSDLF